MSYLDEDTRKFPEFKKNMERLTKRQIIEETAAFYNLGNRSTAHNIASKHINNCKYNGTDGKKCAVARCLNLDDNALSDLDTGQTGAISDLMHDSVVQDDHFNPQYRGHSGNFWGDLQMLHDNAMNWDDDGISNSGQDMVDTLIHKHTL